MYIKVRKNKRIDLIDKFHLNVSNKIVNLDKNIEDESLISLNSRLSLVLITIAIVFFGVIVLPFFFGEIDPSQLGSLGSGFSGFVLPLVSIAAALLTFLAFYIQYKANLQIQGQFKIQQFESQFYEMLRLHKENITEMKITGYEVSTTETMEFENGSSNNKIKITKAQIPKLTEGRKIFVTMVTELIACYELLEYFSSIWDLDTKKKDLLQLAYQIFFFGANSKAIKSENIPKAQIEQFKYALNDVRLNHKSTGGIKNIYTGKGGKQIKLYIKYSPFSGHESRLGHYYRHLYSTVRFVVENEGILFDYDQARKYLKILRSQLSNDEVLMLYYNCIIGFGQDWVKKDFLTKYRMIHNLPTERVEYLKNPKIYFKDFIKSIEDIDDPLFEW